MMEHQNQNKDLLQTNSEEGNCDFSQKQARMEMKKEDERKIVSKMLKKL